MVSTRWRTRSAVPSSPEIISALNGSRWNTVFFNMIGAWAYIEHHPVIKRLFSDGVGVRDNQCQTCSVVWDILKLQGRIPLLSITSITLWNGSIVFKCCAGYFHGYLLVADSAYH